MRRYKVVIADDHPLFRAALIRLLNREPGFECAGEATTFSEIQPQVAQTQPNVLILDLRFPDGNALDVIGILKQQYPELAIVVLTQWEETLYADRALREGAIAYVTKQEAGEEIARAIHSAIRGRVYVSREMALRLRQQQRRTSERQMPATPSQLSTRELRIFGMIGTGMRTEAIAESLHLRTKAVEAHIEKMKRRLRLENDETLLEEATDWVHALAWRSGRAANASRLVTKEGTIPNGLESQGHHPDIRRVQTR